MNEESKTFEDGMAAYRLRDFDTCLKIWLPLANHGDAQAQNMLGWMYRGGFGVNKDPIESLNWFRKAADQGASAAQFQVSEFYAYGWGVKQDWEEAYFWERLSLKQRVSKGMAVDSEMTAAKIIYKIDSHLTPEQKVAVEKRVAEWRPSPSSQKN